MIKDSSGNQRFYGVYRAVVFDNKDPNSLGRLRLKIPQVFANVPTGWSWPTSPAGVRTTSPSIGQGIWVMFEGGDPSFPMWIGVFGNEVSSDTTVAINPAAKGTILPYNMSVSSNTDGSRSIDLVQSLISVASVIDGGNA
jgi:hypothetical protein